MLDFGALHEESPAEEHNACTITVVQGVPASSSAWLDATEDQLARRARFEVSRLVPQSQACARSRGQAAGILNKASG